jgi:hypothetical protein
MRLRALCAAAVLSLSIPLGCSLLPDDGSGGTVSLGGCTGGPVSVSIPALVYCDVTRIAATVSGPDMTTREVAIDRDNASATLTIPSGPERSLVVRVFTADNPAAPSYTSSTYNFCVADGEPVSVSVDVIEANRNPDVGAISPAPAGVLTRGSDVALSVTATDPDACDGVRSYTWSADFGVISGSGDKVVWNPDCPTGRACQATVTVTVQDGRGGATTVQSTYPVSVIP